MDIYHCVCVCLWLQSTKMILKFRETHIGNIEKGKRGQRVGASEAARKERGDDTIAAVEPPHTKTIVSIRLTYSVHCMCRQCV